MKRIASSLFALALLGACASGSSSSTSAPSSPRVAVSVDGQGFHPERVAIHANEPTTLVFTRTTDHTCGTQVTFPSLGIRRDLPLDQPVEIALPAQPAGTIAFTCGMNMLRGSVVAE